MREDELQALADRVESAARPDDALATEIVQAIGTAFPEASLPEPGAQLLRSTEAALRLVDAMVPAWAIAIKGVALEPDGHWTCTIRKSMVSDETEVIGIGEAPSLPRALIAAAIRIAALQRPR